MFGYKIPSFSVENKMELTGIARNTSQKGYAGLGNHSE